VLVQGCSKSFKVKIAKIMFEVKYDICNVPSHLAKFWWLCAYGHFEEMIQSITLRAESLQIT